MARLYFAQGSYCLQHKQPAQKGPDIIHSHNLSVTHHKQN